MYWRSIGGESGHINEYRGHILDRIHQNILKKYHGRIGGVLGRIGAYRDVSRRIGVVRILRYANWSIGYVSYANRTRTRIKYVSDTGYVAVLPNLYNINKF
jgi:hypothetical protein